LAGNSGGGTGRPTSPTRTPWASPGGSGSPAGPQNLCAQDFQAPLTGVRAATLTKYTVTSDLDVGLAREGEFVTVVCRVPGTDQVVGSLAAFRGVRELIRCLEQGFEYAARVVSISATQVDVHVRRKNP
jgi:hypothetical protein